MRSFTCPVCSHLVFFENNECLRCHAALGFAADTGDIIALGDTDRPYRRCTNAMMAECNWVLPTGGDQARGDDHGGLCLSCRLTRTRPNDDDPDALVSFAETEAAKRRLVFQLLELGLPVAPHHDGNQEGLAFDLLSSEFEKVTIGHADGLITLNLAESDDAYREDMRQNLGEAYRTMLGHLRHETGHYYFPLIVAPDDQLLARARDLFGDDTLDYGDALDQHYRNGPPVDWPEQYVSSYATMHPFEDWAETFAHYLHIRDTLQTAAAFGMQIAGPAAARGDVGELASAPALDSGDTSFEKIISDWLPLTYALNAVNRSMGNADLYPFVLTPKVIEKLTFVHQVVGRQADKALQGV